MFSCKFAAYFQDTFLCEHLWKAAPVESTFSFHLQLSPFSFHLDFTSRKTPPQSLYVNLTKERLVIKKLLAEFFFCKKCKKDIFKRFLKRHLRNLTLMKTEILCRYFDICSEKTIALKHRSVFYFSTNQIPRKARLDVLVSV